MSARVLFIGGGDVGLQMADGLMRREGAGIARLTVADLDGARLGAAVSMLDTCHRADVAFAELDALETGAVENLIRRETPDLIVQAASLISPWSIIGRDHPTARALNAAGIGVQLPVQLPIVLSVMRAVRDAGWDGPLANVSNPDFIHPILTAMDLAPAIGLGNASILHLRAAAALKARRRSDTDPGDAVAEDTIEDDLIRIVGHHKQVYDVMQARPPEDPEDRVWVFVGEAGTPDDALAYEGRPFAAGPVYNVITAASALPVLAALLPGAAAARFSAPGPRGLPGGYPVRIAGGAVALDLPHGVAETDAVAFNTRIGRRDGIAGMDADGTVRFSDTAAAAVADVDPSLAAPLNARDMGDRTARLLALVRGMGPA